MLIQREVLVRRIALLPVLPFHSNFTPDRLAPSSGRLNADGTFRIEEDYSYYCLAQAFALR